MKIMAVVSGGAGISKGASHIGRNVLILGFLPPCIFITHWTDHILLYITSIYNLGEAFCSEAIDIGGFYIMDVKLSNTII